MKTFLKNLVADIVKLRMPVTAASAVTTIVTPLEPFGLDFGAWTPRVTGALVVLGVVTAYVQSRGGGVIVKTNPATLPTPPRGPLP